MKTLYLIRHAKSSWSFDLADHDRPLGKRGRKDVFSMSTYLARHQLLPDVLVSSTASRAFYTALHFCDAMGMDERGIVLEKNLYHATPHAILEVVQRVKSGDCLALFGHNPGFTEAANMLCKSSIENVPTCGIVGITFDVYSWPEVAAGKGSQLFFYTPKTIVA